MNSYIRQVTTGTAGTTIMVGINDRSAKSQGINRKRWMLEIQVVSTVCWIPTTILQFNEAEYNTMSMVLAKTNYDTCCFGK